MKIQELLFEENVDDYIRRLVRKEHIKKIGRGVYSTVLQHPVYHNVVVKVFTGGDVGYRNYLKFIKANQHNKYVPKIISIHFIWPTEVWTKTDLSNQIGIVFMKKLTKATNTEIKQLVKRFIKLVREYDEGMADEIDGAVDFEDWSNDCWGYVALAAKKTDPDLASLARYFKRMKPQDIHNGNIMKDPDGHLVFTDPLAY